jgi:hypothetical protein
MSHAAQRRVLLAILMIVAAAMFLAGIGWGLPSRDADPYLFGDHPVWSGSQIMRFAGERRDDPNLGANVPQHLLAGRDKILVLNETDEQRAEIVRRYRLYSYQPDENTLLMAIARMKPAKGDFDPKFYQYGGLFVYPVGLALKVAGLLHLIDLRGDVAWYIDHPDAFGRFYVVARLTAALWGVVGVWAVFWIARRLSGATWAAAFASLCYVFLPVVINGAHEAKPHLPGAVLMLCAVIAASRYVETGRRKQALVAGALCGAAFATVLSAALVFIVLPVMAFLRPGTWRARVVTMILAGVMGAGVYVATNPYVAINLVRNREVLKSNLTNSTDMYRVGGWRQGVPNALKLLAEGATPGLAMAGAVAAAGGLIVSVRRRRTAGGPAGGRFALGVLLAAVVLLVLAQYVALAAGKPGEYGRFATFPDVALAIAAVSGAALWVRQRLVAGAILSLLLLATAGRGLDYVGGFLADARHPTSRLDAAQWIALSNLAAGRSTTTIATWAEPAPYVMPPVNLFRDRLLLLPDGYEPHAGDWPADLLVRAADAPTREPEPWALGLERMIFGRYTRPARISWAQKPIVILESSSSPGRKP